MSKSPPAVKAVIPSIVPPFISTVVTIPKSATVFPALVQFPCIDSKSKVVVDVLPNEPVESAEPLTLPFLNSRVWFKIFLPIYFKLAILGYL